MALAELMGISARRKPPAPAAEAEVRIDLFDGSLLAAREFTTHNGRRGSSCRPRPVPSNARGRLAAVRFQPDTTAALSEWARLLKLKTPGDLLVIVRGEIVDYQPGAAGDVTARTVAFDLDGEVVAVKRGKVFGLIYHAAAGPEAEPVCWIATPADRAGRSAA